MKRSMYVVTSFSVPIWIRIQAHCIASRASNIIMDVWGPQSFCSCCTNVLIVGIIDCECLVEAISFHGGADCACGCEGSVGDDLSKRHCCVILRLVMFAPHSDEDLVGSQYCLLWKVSCFPGVLVILFDQTLVFSPAGHVFGTLSSRLGMGAAAGIAVRGSAAVWWRSAGLAICLKLVSAVQVSGGDGSCHCCMLSVVCDMYLFCSTCHLLFKLLARTVNCV